MRLPLPSFAPAVRFASRSGLLAVCAACLLWSGCDETPGPTALNPEPPEVADFSFSPSRVAVDELPPERVQDSVVVIPLTVQARATDPDGTIDRVELTIEPSKNPRGTFLTQLPRADGNRYAGALNAGLPALDEIYTVRVYAIDDDSLISNQVRGQLRVVAPQDTTDDESSSRN